MFALVYSVNWDPGRLDQVLDYVRQISVPTNQNLKGFKGYRLLVDRPAGRGLGITYWDTEADLRVAENVTNQLRAQSAAALNLKRTTYEHYEVLVDLSESEYGW